jgi:hypothetical protein
LDEHCDDAHHAKPVVAPAWFTLSHRRPHATGNIAGLSNNRRGPSRNNHLAGPCDRATATPAAVGDLMTAFVQPRHIKFALAGREDNSPYAAYELDQLRETFADLADILPKCRDLSIPDLIRSTVKEPLAALDRAIQAKDGNSSPRLMGS